MEESWFDPCCNMRSLGVEVETNTGQARPTLSLSSHLP